MDKEIRIRFGQYIFAFLCENLKVIDLFKLHYNKYISHSSPTVYIILSITLPARSFVYKPGTHLACLVHEENFNFGPNLVKGTWDKKKRTWHLFNSKSLLNKENIWLFDRLFCRLFYTLSMGHKNDKEKAVIIHSSGIIKEKKGYLFFGPPGSGKSTIAHFSRKFDILNDDMNIVTINDKETFVEGAPFNPKHLELTNSRVPLSIICSLHKSDKVSIEKGTPEEFARKIIPEVFLPLPVLSEDRKDAFQYMLRCIKELGNNIPYYRLYFKNDESFWDKIDKAEEDYARH